MAKYTRTEKVEAVQIKDTDFGNVADFLGEDQDWIIDGDMIRLPDQPVTAAPGDYLVRHADGTFSVSPKKGFSRMHKKAKK